MNDAPTVPSPDQALSCPSCHSVLAHSTGDAHVAGSDWKCNRCGEHWTASRLATVAEYEAWDRERRGIPLAALGTAVG